MSYLARFACLALAAYLMFGAPVDAQAPYGFQHVSTRETAHMVLYDLFHQRFYGTVPGEDAVYIISEANGSVIQKISVPSAYGLDLSVDGSQLYVSSSVTILGYAAAQMVFVIDTTTLHIVNIIRPTSSFSQSSSVGSDTMAGSLASLSNGKLAYTATSIGVTGGTIFVYDPATGISTFDEPVNYYAGLLYKAASGNGFVSVSANSAGEYVSVYDTASATYISNVGFGSNNSDVVMSPDGNMVLVGGHILCNRSLQEIADLAGPGQPTSLAWTSQGSSFSPDGTKIYVASSLNATTTLPGGGTSSYSNPVLYIFSSSTYQLLATLPLPEGSPATLSGYSGVAVGSSGKAMLVDNTGFLEMDPAAAPATLPGTYSQSLNTFQPTSPDAGTLTSPQSTSLSGSGFRAGARAYFGQTPVNTTYVSQSALTLQPPSGSPGLVDISVVFPDGWAVLQPEAYSYGPVITKQSETAGSTNGGTSVTLYGNGFDAANTSSYPTVLVGGRTATVTASNSKSVTFTTPAGSLGPADIQLTSIFGTTTIAGGFTYLNQQLIPSLLANQMIVDNVRNQIYVADGNSGSVFVVNATTLAATVLFTPPSGGVTALAMTPDGSQLVAANAYTSTLDIIDLATARDVKTIIPIPGNVQGTFYPAEIAATANGTALVALVSTTLYDYGELVEVNLATGATTLLQPNLFSGVLLASSADGSIVYIAVSSADGSSGGAPQQWSAAANGILKTSVAGEYGPADLSTTDLGDRMMDDCYTLDQADTWLRVATVCAPDSQLRAGRDLVYGVRIHSSGSLGYLPTTKGVEIFDIHHGQTVAAIGDAAGSLEGTSNLAISHDGSRLYIAQPNGIGVITLPAVPLSIGSLTPSSGNASGGETIVMRGSGFLEGVTVTVDGKPAGVQFIDSTQLILTMPAVTAAEDIVTVTNPGGNSYTLDAAWNAIPATNSVPVLSSITPVLVTVGATDTFTLNGSGFTPGSVAFLNGAPGRIQFLGTTQLSATFSHLPGPGTQSVTVENLPDTTPSNALSIITHDAAPFLNSLTPSSIPVGSASFELTAFGNVILAPTSVLQWNGTALASQLIDPNHIVAMVPASLVASIGTASVTIYTPQATPSVSNAVTFTITPSVSAMTVSISQLVLGPSLAGGTASATFTITSTGAIPLVISSLSSSDTHFSFSGCITTLSQGQSCTATATYTPNSSGVQENSGHLTITSNATVPQPTIPVAGNSGALAFYPSSTQVIVVPGQSVSDAINVTSYGSTPAFTAQLNCSGLPANATCSFTPASVSMPFGNGSGNLESTFTVMFATQAPTIVLLRDVHPWRGMITMATAFCLLWFPRRRRPALLACLCISLIAGMAGCSSGTTRGSGSGTPVGGTPTGIYPITVTATVPGTTPMTTGISLLVN